MGNWLVAETVRTDATTLVHLVGQVDAATLEDLQLAVRPHIKAQATVVVDLAGISFLAERTLRALPSAVEIYHGSWNTLTHGWRP